jgi:hypothetical protein
VECALRNPPGFTAQFDAAARIDSKDFPRLMEFLQANGELRGYTNYWVSYPMAFLSREQILYTARLPYHQDLRYTPRDDRYAPYDELVFASDRIAYITTNNPLLDIRLSDAFARENITCAVEQIGDFRIYYRLSRAIRPEELDLGNIPP